MDISASELQQYLRQYWPDEAELAGAQLLESAAVATLSGRQVDPVYFEGGSDWPLIETAALVAAICEIILVTLEIAKLKRGKAELPQTYIEVKSELTVRIPALRQDIIESENFNSLLKSILDDLHK